MTAIIKKENLKTELIREYNLLKNFIDIESNEGTIDSVIAQIVENIHRSENNSNYHNSKKIHNKLQLKKKLVEEKNQALGKIVLHKGSFF